MIKSDRFTTLFHVADLASPVSRSLKTIPAVLEVIKSLLQLLVCVQHEWSIVCDWLVYRLSCEKDEACIGCHCSDRDVLILALMSVEWNSMGRLPLLSTLHFQSALVQHNETVPAGWDSVTVALASLVDDKVDEPSGGTGNDRPLNTKDFTRDHLRLNTVPIIAKWDCIRFELLVLGHTELVLGLKVDPELEADGFRVKASRHLSMDNALSSSHPL